MTLPGSSEKRLTGKRGKLNTSQADPVAASSCAVGQFLSISCEAFRCLTRYRIMHGVNMSWSGHCNEVNNLWSPLCMKPGVKAHFGGGKRNVSLEWSPLERGHGGHDWTPSADGSVWTWRCQNDLRRLLQIYRPRHSISP